jgi:hypothetical protein
MAVEDLRVICQPTTTSSTRRDFSTVQTASAGFGYRRSEPTTDGPFARAAGAGTILIGECTTRILSMRSGGRKKSQSAAA